MKSPDSLKIAIAQCNFTVGDLPGNKAKILEFTARAAALKADLIVFSELAVCGYPPEDLVLRPAFQEKAIRAIKEIAAETRNMETAILVGGIDLRGGELFNTAFLIEQGKIIYRQYKYDLPNYGVFDEKRVFAAGGLPKPVKFRGANLGIFICEDMWNAEVPEAMKGADILISINGSPFEKNKAKLRLGYAKSAVKIAAAPLVYVNQIGGQDELVFDGGSFVISEKSQEKIALPLFEEKLFLANFQREKSGWKIKNNLARKTESEDEIIYNALVLALKDYVRKNKFSGVVIGISGGIDSALSAAIAVDALGPENVLGVMMPSCFTSEESLKEARQLAKNLGIRLEEIPIDPAFSVFRKSLHPLFTGRPEDITEENMQSRIRGLLLMAISNKLGLMVLTTGNKSEMSVGYATLYGDMCGGYSVLKDIYKTEVYRLAKWRNKQGNVIPKRTITRPPTAELRHNQKDEDSLPPYEILDAILEMMIERELPKSEIIAAGYDKKIVEKIAKAVNLSEYKRRQAPPGVKITTRSFGRDRRYPITNKFVD